MRYQHMTQFSTTMPPQTKIYRFLHQNIWKHLATEEYLLNRLVPEQKILYLWQSADAIVIGKNQNPWNECFFPPVKQGKLNLARRLSGGGTVYQDYGNLNFTFIAHRELYNFDDHIRIISKALQTKGIFLTLEKDHTLTVNGSKCSGNAFCFRNEKALHHGTLLINTDIKKLELYLQPCDYHIKTRAVASKRAKVVNLSDIVTNINCADTISLIIDSFTESNVIKPQIIDCEEVLDVNELQKLYRKYTSWEWIYGYTPKFEVCWQKEFFWGNCTLHLHITKGIITDVRLGSKSFNSSDKTAIKNTILGCRFTSESVGDRIRTWLDSRNGNQNAYLVDIADWMEERCF